MHYDKEKPINCVFFACDTLMTKFEDVMTLPPANKFHYHQGVFLSGMEQAYLLTKEKKYNDYIKAWVDGIVDEDGVITRYDEKSLDDFRSGTLLFRLFEETKEKRYEKPIYTTWEHLN